MSSRMVVEFKNLLDEDVVNKAPVVCRLDEATVEDLMACFQLNSHKHLCSGGVLRRRGQS